MLLADGFLPGAGDEFDLLSFDSVSNSFGTLDLPALPVHLAWDSDDLLTTGVLKVVAALLIGDANNDGLVTGLDLIAVQENFGSTEVGDPPTGGLPGDANDDGRVTGLDLITVQENFGRIRTPDFAPVPEPRTALVLLAGLLARRRSNRPHRPGPESSSSRSKSSPRSRSHHAVSTRYAIRVGGAARRPA